MVPAEAAPSRPSGFGDNGDRPGKDDHGEEQNTNENYDGTYAHEWLQLPIAEFHEVERRQHYDETQCIYEILDHRQFLARLGWIERVITAEYRASYPPEEI